MKKYLIIILILLILGGGTYFVIRGNKDNNDNIRFSKEYSSVGDENVFVYRSVDEVIKILENGTGVIYLGFPECPWCQAYVKYLNEVAKEEGVDKIYYFNILEDRKENTASYQKIVSLLNDYLQYDEEGNRRVYVPNVTFVINGKIIGNDYETSLDTHGLEKPEEYWTEIEVKELKENLKKYMNQVYIALNACTECGK